MKLSEYIKHLQKIARAEKKVGRDPEVVESRWSDTALLRDDNPPELIHGVPRQDAEWVEEINPKTYDGSTPLKTYVMVN
jgi:hypothetical protein